MAVHVLLDHRIIANSLIGTRYCYDVEVGLFLIFNFWVQQARGLKKHLKRLNAPKHWMLDKLGGAFVS